jgi:KDO2-lipid IV(A) lauroyltransferase
VVGMNIQNSFPGKNEAERLKLERRFYHHFADYIVETIKLTGIPEKELLERAHITNPELLHELVEKGHTCVLLMMGHYGNWEWFSGASKRFDNRIKVNLIYRPLKNKAIDRIFLYMRTRFNSLCIKKNEAVRDIIKIKQSKIPSLVVFVADQTPSRANLHYWTSFLNQESSVLTGPERIAQKLDIPVIFDDLRQVRRGYYTVDFKLVTDKPRETPKFYITEKYTRLMEESIMRDPALWLWTHKRWKHKKESDS